MKLVKVGDTSFFWEDVVAIHKGEYGWAYTWLHFHMKGLEKSIPIHVSTDDVEQIYKDFEASRLPKVEQDFGVYDENFGDDKICKCGHPYYRHFDTYDHMSHVGCKYCECFTWKPHV